MPVADVDASRVNADEHVVVADLGPIDLLEPQDVRGLLAVRVLHHSAHRAVRRSGSAGACCPLLTCSCHRRTPHQKRA